MQENIFEYYSKKENQIIDIRRSGEALKDVIFAKGWHTTIENDVFLIKALEIWGLRNFDGLIPYSEIPDNKDYIGVQFPFTREDVFPRKRTELKENALDTIYHLSFIA